MSEVLVRIAVSLANWNFHFFARAQLLQKPLSTFLLQTDEG